jgi:hypothetical protein
MGALDCRVRVENGVTMAYNQDGTPSQLYMDAFLLTKDVNKALDIWAAAYSEEFQIQMKDASMDNITVEEVQKFIDTKASTGKKLVGQDRAEIISLMEKSGIETLSELYSKLSKIFKSTGVLDINAEEAVKSGLYTMNDLVELDVEDLRDILESIEGTLAQTDFYVERQPKTGFLDATRKSILGTSVRVSEEVIFQNIIDSVEDLSDVTQVDKAIDKSPYQAFFAKDSNRDKLNTKLKGLKRVPIVTVVDGKISTQDKSTEKEIKNTFEQGINTLELRADIALLTRLDKSIWESKSVEAKRTLKRVERELAELGIDVVGIHKNWRNREGIINLLQTVVKTAANPSAENMTELANVKDKVLPKKRLPGFVTEVKEVLQDLKVVRFDTELSADEVFEKYSMVKVGDNLYHVVTPGTKDVMYEYVYQKVINDELKVRTIKDYKKPENKDKVIADLVKKFSSMNVGFETKNTEMIALIQTAFEHPTIAKEKSFKKLSNIKTNENYLKTDFISDFYKYVLTEKAKDSDLYREVLSQFQFSDNDITLNKPIKGIENLKYAQELSDYLVLKKDYSLNKLVKEESSTKLNDVLIGVNNPLSLKQYSQEHVIKGEYVFTQKSTEDVIKVGDKVYVKVVGDGASVTIFKEAPKTSETYYTNNVYPEVGVDELEDLLKQSEGLFTPKTEKETPKETTAKAKQTNVVKKTTPKKQVSNSITVYHGGNVSELTDISKDNPLFVSEDEKQASEYTKENEGVVSSFTIDYSKIASEEVIRETIKELDLRSKEDGWDTDELGIHELIDNRFPTSFSDSDIIQLFDRLEEKGYYGGRFTDTNLITLKEDIQNIFIFSPKAEIARPKKQVVGQLAALRNYDLSAKLDQAKTMFDEGVDPGQIEVETGWTLIDGDWKYFAPEILKSLKQKVDFNTLEIDKPYNLSDLIESDLLFELYPELKNQKVEIVNGESAISKRYTGQSFSGVYDRGTIYISIYGQPGVGTGGVQSDLPGDRAVGVRYNDNQVREGSGVSRELLALVHELQHAIQYKEGFSKGGDLYSVLRQTPKATTFDQGLFNKLRKLFSELYPEIKLNITDKPVFEISGKDIYNQQNISNVKNQYKEGIKHLKELLDDQDMLSKLTFQVGSLQPFIRASLLYKGLVIDDHIYPTKTSIVELDEEKLEPDYILTKEEYFNHLMQKNVDIIKYVEDQIYYNIKIFSQGITEIDRIQKVRSEKTTKNKYDSNEVPEHVVKAAEEVLTNGFKGYEFLAKDLNALPLIANIANMYAKVINAKYYDLKDDLTEYLAYKHPSAWSKGDGIMYIETPIAQVSFHVFNHQDSIALKFGLDPSGRNWSGEEVQFVSEDLLRDYIQINNIKPYNESWEEVQEKFDKNPNLKVLKNIWLQTNKGSVIGQANIQAMTVLIDAVNQKQDTLPHEYAHHYIAWFRDSKIVKDAINKWGSEEALVQAIGEQVVKQKGEVFNWWKSFSQWVKGIFGTRVFTKEDLAKILTDSFLRRESLEVDSYQQAIYNPMNDINQKAQAIAQMRNVDFELLGDNNIQDLEC